MREQLRHPARLVPLSFAIAVALGTALLMLPVSRAGPGGADFVTALFTATSAACVTGLIVVDTPTYWSPFGQGVILVLIQVGGFGIMTGATLLGLLVSRRLGLRTRLVAQAETRILSIGDVAPALRLILAATLAVEALVWIVLALRLRLAYGEPWPGAIWNGLFHSVSAFNNAGFSTYTDNVMGFASDWLFLGPIMLAVAVGGIGFPVIADLWRNRQPARWSVHTKVTLLGSAVLLALGTLAVLAYEWSNPGTIGDAPLHERILGALFHSVVSRTAGFNSLDVAEMTTATLLVTNALMFVGGGSAGTAGGIKVSTAFVLLLTVWAEIRGEEDTVAFRRRLSSHVQRQALSVVVAALLIVAAATLYLETVTSFPLELIMFEVVSAFATVGLSAGITAQLPPSGELVLVVLMFLGRVGSITFATGLALAAGRRPYQYPEERPIIG
ncbi:TrkH family potassium uptake protein [Antarcticirhabdus aurantiaca]|uniref:TrkH family potassium uptake protein n=1 Tax=Antarcticirhabdus aurantiaca TaxID=2606717 RepID=A0ACD4NKF6_9HYPH|nr:potassium transporter TrkG [Antarcticirhabdus aurantiaca]WAJ27242.1 TrkH family potassium uptake protein [Jeongeuplla avenae]